jgi:hypothetical protein
MTFATHSACEPTYSFEHLICPENEEKQQNSWNRDVHVTVIVREISRFATANKLYMKHSIVNEDESDY